MAFSFFCFVFIYYPYIKEFLFPSVFTAEEIESSEFSIQIPSINVFSKISENVNPFNEAEYIEKLKNGAAHAKGTGLPGDGKTVFLFAHSSDVPWRISRYNTAFFKLSFVNKGERITLRRNGEVFFYKVFDKKTVWPSEVDYLKKDQGDILILQTCTPIGTSLQRLLVFAKPTN